MKFTSKKTEETHLGQRDINMPSGVYPRTKEHIKKAAAGVGLAVARWNKSHSESDRWGSRAGKARHKI
jgi:hypothetical protein